MSEIAFVNQSNGRLSDADGRTIADAIRVQLGNGVDDGRFCAMWGFTPPIVSFYPTGTIPPASSWPIPFIDQPPSDVKGAEAYHTDAAGRPSGFVFAGFLLDNGGDALTSENCVAAAASHEALELIRDRSCTVWIEMPLTGPDGNSYTRIAAEVCDPVQGNSQIVSVNGQNVRLSAYVLPGWEDPTSPGPYDSAGALTGPGQVAPAGYAMYENDSGQTAQVMGKEVPEHIQHLKRLIGRNKHRQVVHARAKAARESEIAGQVMP